MKKPLILDGAMGTELMRRGIELPLPLWSAESNMENPDIVLDIHKDYVSAGADVLTTNTFRTTTWAYRKAGYTPKRASEQAKTGLMRAVDLAVEGGEDNTIIAGSLTALEDCYEPEKFPGTLAAEETYGETSEWFLEAGIEVLLFETMGHLEEINAALKVTQSLNAERWLSLILKSDSELLSGHSLIDTINVANSSHLSFLLLNCNTIDMTSIALDCILNNRIGNWGLYPNLGVSTPEKDGHIDSLISHTQFEKKIIEYWERGASIIGACCGSTPNHIQLIRELIDTHSFSA